MIDLILASVFISIGLWLLFIKKTIKISINEEYILAATKNAFLEGYKAALNKKDSKSAWIELSEKYKFNK